jgi:hypothetical protein
MLRVMYISIFYPLLIISFLLATIEDTFQTAFIFGFPVFVIGIFILPYSAHVMNKEARVVVKGNAVLIYCKNCYYPFEMFKTEKTQRCPLCGTSNDNYFLSGAIAKPMPKQK